MSVSRVLTAGVVAALLAGGARARDLAIGVATPPPVPDYNAALRRVLVQPFERGFGVSARLESFDPGAPDGAKAAAPGTPDAPAKLDVLLLGEDALEQACNAKLLEPLDWDALGGRGQFLPQGASTCGAGAVMQSDVLAWDLGKFRDPPNWADFWDVARRPGQRGLKRDVRPALEIALMADGVPPGQVYAVLSTPQGVDRAFRKLDQIKPYIVWWTHGAQAIELLRSGKVLMSVVPSTEAVAPPPSSHAAAHAPAAGSTPGSQPESGPGPGPAAAPGAAPAIGVQWAQSLYTVRSWAIIAGTPNQHAAQQFVAFASNPERQGELMALTHLGALAVGAGNGQPEAVLRDSPSTQANLQNALEVDSGFWRQNYAALEQRFLAWLAK